MGDAHTLCDPHSDGRRSVRPGLLSSMTFRAAAIIVGEDDHRKHGTEKEPTHDNQA